MPWTIPVENITRCFLMIFNKGMYVYLNMRCSAHSTTLWNKDILKFIYKISEFLKFVLFFYWPQIKEYLADPNLTEANRFFAQCYLNQQKSGATISPTLIDSWNRKTQHQIYTIQTPSEVSVIHYTDTIRGECYTPYRHHQRWVSFSDILHCLQW